MAVEAYEDVDKVSSDANLLTVLHSYILTGHAQVHVHMYFPFWMSHKTVGLAQLLGWPF